MNMEKKNTGKNLLYYFGGLMLMTLGVAISVKSDLGVTPVSSIPYTMTVVTGMDLGIATILFSVFMVLLQIIMQRKDFKPYNLLQIPISIIFGLFMTASGKLMNCFPDIPTFTLRFLVMLFSTVFVAIGVFLYVSSGLIPLPTEGFLIVAAEKTGIRFASLKVFFDVAMVLISLATCLLMVHSLGSVGIGTIVSAVLVGNEIKLIQAFLSRILPAR